MSVLDQGEMQKFDRWAKELNAATGKSVREILFQWGRIFVSYCAKLTAPFKTWKNVKESWTVQRKTGEAAVERDIRRLFTDVNALQMLKNPQNLKLGAALKKAVDAGDIEAVRNILHSASNLSRDKVILGANRKHHAASRDRRGRVLSGKTYNRIVMLPSSIDALVGAKKRDVGTAKSGWNRAAVALGLKLPGWIKNKSEPGQWTDKTADKTEPHIIVGNLSPIASGAQNDRRIIPEAFRLLLRSMQKQAEIIINKNWRRFTR